MGERLQSARERRGWSKRQLAERSGVHDSTILRIERGDTPNPGSETLRQLAAALGIPAAQLTGDAPRLPPPVRIFEDVAVLPIVQNLAVEAGGGSGVGTWIDTGDTTSISANLAHGRQLRAIRVVGDCMAPEIDSGDVVVFDIGRREPQDGEIIVCWVVDPALLVKRFYRLANGNPLLASNDGQRIIPTELLIEGVVVHVNKTPRRKPLD